MGGAEYRWHAMRVRAGFWTHTTTLLATLLGAPACHTRQPLELLLVHRIDPSRASAGDRVTLTGEGFPEGRTATVTFRGDLLRPGLPRKTDVRITATATPSNRGAVSMTFDRAMERRFVRSGDAAPHTTFVG